MSDLARLWGPMRLDELDKPIRNVEIPYYQYEDHGSG